jgi:hypothetical protein
MVGIHSDAHGRPREGKEKKNTRIGVKGKAIRFCVKERGFRGKVGKWWE